MEVRPEGPEPCLLLGDPQVSLPPFTLMFTLPNHKSKNRSLQKILENAEESL